MSGLAFIIWGIMPAFEFEGEIPTPVNVLADRYASPEMVATFSETAKVYLERELWITVMREQAALGLDIPAATIDDYVAAQPQIDLDSIRDRERLTRHDVKAKIEEFNDVAGGHEYVHRGMTSRDLTENVEQLQIARGLEIVQDRIVTTLGRFAARAVEFEAVPLTGRSHNVAAQTITLGKRFANFGEELLLAYTRIRDLKASYPLRGIKGPVGTQQDMLELFDGDAEKVAELERRIAQELGFSAVFGSVGQVYPRSLDLEVITALQQAAGGPSSFAHTLRLMAGNELITEGFKEGQVGSSAMPHKMNSRTSERINGFNAVLAGYATMAGHLSGDQWNEGDVSCSVVRRVMIPDAFYATDGLFQATLTVLDELGAYPAVIERELQRYLPFLTTTKVLMAAVKAGGDREKAHEAIKEHAIAVALEMRERGLADNDLFDRLAADARLPVTKQDLLEAAERPLGLTGLVRKQVADFAERIETIVEENPEAANYQPAPLL